MTSIATLPQSKCLWPFWPSTPADVAFVTIRDWSSTYHVSLHTRSVCGELVDVQNERGGRAENRKVSRWVKLASKVSVGRACSCGIGHRQAGQWNKSLRRQPGPAAKRNRQNAAVAVSSFSDRGSPEEAVDDDCSCFNRRIPEKLAEAEVCDPQQLRGAASRVVRSGRAG
ncbi:hypothetical protein GALMADRAFT_256415 [Galerina marginata CBS 339.88]|uniref:Uncharacterized protein n=1 Tax=Galerina marginata (strain CBS 339.88) TaxID=685588 RepID=A0A067SDG1_GALM3|nr:hypothetical protein GALMADRAFT_256415 [Galerina marginata CBS 339.88]